MTEQAAQSEPNPFEQALVRESWAMIEVMERLGEGPTARAFALRWEATRAKGEEFYAPVASGEWFTQESAEMYESPTNRSRFARTVDFIRPGDRVMEIGIGHGFLALMALKAGEAGAYRGIELVQGNVDRTRQVLASNGYADRASAEQGNLYDLTRDVVADHKTDLLICCEVLEHVPDPEAALEVLANALPEGTDLLISVPLRGRLEGIWGHVAQFGVGRVRDMVQRAGLTVHHVEPLANTWVFLLASRNPQGSGRAALAAAAIPDVTAGLETPEDWSLRVENVDPEPVEARWVKGLVEHEVRKATRGVVLTARAGTEKRGQGKNAYAGVAFECKDVRGVRIEFDPIDLSEVKRLHADFYQGSTRVGRWTWDPSEHTPKQERPTFMLTPERAGVYFRRKGAEDISAADRFEVFAELEPGSSVTFGITRIGWFK